MSEWLDGNDELNNVLHDLIQASLAGEADEADQMRLERLIVEDPIARQLYVRYMVEAAGLQLLGSSEDIELASAKWITELKEDEEEFPRTDSAEAASPSQSGSRAGKLPPQREFHGRIERRSRSRLLRAVTGVGLSIIASAAAVALLVSFNLLTWAPNASVVSNQRVAQLQSERDAILQLNGESVRCETGQWLLNGSYQLEQGIVQLVFPWGTEATFEAPAQFELQANEQRRLMLGRMIAKVPAEDTGFTVDTPTVEVIDLGTEFGLMVSNDGDCEVHVFKGEVETRAKRNADPLAQRMGAGSATRFASDPASVDAVDVIYNPHRFARAWQTANRITQVTGAVRFVYPPPKSVAAGDFESEGEIRVFLERQNVSFPTATAVTLTQPGLYTSFATSRDWLPSRLELDSYLLHFDPLGNSLERAAVSVEGSVTFDRQIVAVITRGDQLAATDAYCASPTTNYFGINKRSANDKFSRFYEIALRGMVGSWYTPLMKEEPIANDIVRLSADRRTLSVQLTASNETDEIRVLVAADDQPIALSWEDMTIATPKPFLGKPFAMGDTIQAENFDIGGDGIAYHDLTPSALSCHYRYDSSVEMLRFEEDDLPAYCIALCKKGEWVGYTVEVEQAGEYVIHIRAASKVGKGQAHFEFGEHLKSKPIVLPKTADALTFEWVESEPVRLTPGRYFARIVMDQPNALGWNGNIDCFRIERLPDGTQLANQ